MEIKHLRMKENHKWRCKPGNKICVLDRGALRFEIPSHWLVEFGEKGAVMLHDRKPSMESCDLGVSLFPVPAEVVPAEALDDMLVQCAKEGREICEQSEVFHEKRGDLEVAWLEQCYIEQEQKRDAKFRVALARCALLHSLITMNYWASRASTLERVWKEVLATLVMGEHIADPTVGPVVQ